MKLKSLAILSAAVALTGCALPNMSITNPGSSGITGNWELTLTDTSGSIAPIGIFLTQSGSTVSGIAWVQMAFPQDCVASGPPCGFPFEIINRNLSGTIDIDGNFVLTSTSSGSNPEVFTITGNTAADTTLNGTYVAASGAYTDRGTVSGSLIAPLNGTYAGTVLSSQTGLSMGVTTTLNQTTAPDATGVLRVTGSAIFTGSSCFTSAAMQGPAATYSGFVGSPFTVDLVSTGNPSLHIEESGSVSPDAKTIQFSYGVDNLSGNGCVNNDMGSGTLTLQ